MKTKQQVRKKCPREFSYVKVRVLWRDWLICKITNTARECKRNTKGGEEGEKLLLEILKRKRFFKIFLKQLFLPAFKNGIKWDKMRVTLQIGYERSPLFGKVRRVSEQKKKKQWKNILMLAHVFVHLTPGVPCRALTSILLVFRCLFPDGFRR